MRVAIAGAGAVGRSIARELLDNGHEVLLIDKNPRSIKVDSTASLEDVEYAVRTGSLMACRNAVIRIPKNSITGTKTATKSTTNAR